MSATLEDIQAKYGDSVYPLYKEQMHEPYMDNEEGEGYQGVVLYDEVEDKIKCNECGKWYKHLPTHLRTHKISTKVYKKKSGLNQHTPLCTPSYSEQRSKIMEKNQKENKCLKGIVEGINKPFPKKNKLRRLVKNTVQRQNGFGLCDVQIPDRLEVARNKEGIITSANLKRIDINLYLWLRHKYGTIEKVCKEYGIEQSKSRLDWARGISEIREFVLKHKKEPTCKDLGRSLYTWQKLFGSWRRAKMMAGLDQLLQEVK